MQYGAAFALLVEIDYKRAPRNITYLTLLAGLASTIMWPATEELQSFLSWREVYLVFAAINLLVGVPIHYCLSILSARRAAIVEIPVDSPLQKREADPLPAHQRSRVFVVTVIGFSLLSFVNGAALAHMIPILNALGLGRWGYR